MVFNRFVDSDQAELDARWLTMTINPSAGDGNLLQYTRLGRNCRRWGRRVLTRPLSPASWKVNGHDQSEIQDIAILNSDQSEIQSY